MNQAAQDLVDQQAWQAQNPVDAAALGADLPREFKALKIALLGYRSHPHVGGQGIYLKYLSRALAALGHQVTVYSGQPYPELDNNIQLIKVPSLNLFEHQQPLRALSFRTLCSKTDFYEWWAKITGAFAEPYTFGTRVLSLINKGDYDIVHDNQSLCYGLLKLQAKGIKVLSTVHHPIHRDRELALQAEAKWGMRLLIRRWYNFLNMQEKVVAKLDNLITVSSTSQQDIAQYFKRPAARTPVIFNGIDTQTFAPNESIKAQDFLILSTASSDQPLKGLSVLLKAIARLKKRFPEIQLHIIGKLKERGANANLIKDLGLESNIRFSSGISTEAMVQAYNEATLVVCPSLYEGFGLPAGEAMACGKLVISSDGGALPEVLGDAGMLVKAGSVDELSKAIELAFCDADLRTQMGRRARNRIVEVFSWESVARELSHYYQTLLVD